MSGTKAEAQKQGEALATVVAEQRIARGGDTTEVTELLKLAMREDVSVDKLERLLTLHERVSDRQASKEFNADLAAFQDECPAIPKNSTAKVTPSSGVRFEYNFADLSTIAATVGPHLHAKGFSFSWDSTRHEGGIECTCTLRHVNGHKETSTFACPTESKAGMSAQQKQASALTYAKRQSLISVLGLTTCDPDDDAAPTATITDKQALDIAALIDEVGADEKRFLKFLGVAEIHGILAADYSRAVRALEDKRNKQR